MFISKKQLPRRTFLKGLGATVALPLLDAMVPAFAATPAEEPATRVRLRAARHGHEPLHAGHGGQRLRVQGHQPLARAVPRPVEHREPPAPSRRRLDRRALAEPDDVAVRRAAEADARRRRLRRRHGRPNRGRRHRPGHAAAVDGGRDRRPLRLDRRLRSRLRLHLHEHVVVAHADDADADGDQSAQGVRADVRPRRQRSRAARAPPRRPQHPRRRDGASDGLAARARRARPPNARQLSRRRARDRAPPDARRIASCGERRHRDSGSAVGRTVRVHGPCAADVRLARARPIAPTSRACSRS